jgi:hypothetical protein
MPTVTELIHSSFRLIGAIAAAETLETNELDDALVSLNQMLASWNTEGASLVARKRLLVSVSGINGPYSLPERPVRIESASVAAGGIDSQLELVDSASWESTPEKQAQSVYVRRLFCDYAYPNASVYIAPIPRLGGQLEMWVYVPLTAFASLATVVDLPPGYEIAVRFNFAMVLLPEYPRSQVDPTLPTQAQMYKASIAQLNAANHIHQAPAVLAGAVPNA